MFIGPSICSQAPRDISVEHKKGQDSELRTTSKTSFNISYHQVNLRRKISNILLQCRTFSEGILKGVRQLEPNLWHSYSGIQARK